MNPPQMLSISDIFSALGGNAEVARAIGVGTSTASEMKRRGRIPPEYWLALIRAARARGISAIDANALVRLHAREMSMGPDATLPEGGGIENGHFTRFERLRRPHFATLEQVSAHVRAMREEWEKRG